MKALLLKQPWATLVASGIVDVLQFAKGTDYRGRVLLYAKRTRLSTKEIDATPIEWIDTIENHVSFGNLENHDVTSAFIGFADLVDVTKEHVDSIWAKGGKDSFRWVFANAHIFDHAYPVDIKSSALLVDTPELDDASLPSSHEVELKYPFFEGNELVVPVEDDLECRRLMYLGNGNRFFDLCYSDERLQKLLMGESMRKKHSFCKSIRLVSPIRTLRFKVVASGLTFDLDGEVKPIVSKEDAKSEFKLFSFELGDMIDMIPPKTIAHVLQRCDVDKLFADGLTPHTLYQIYPPTRLHELRLIKASEGGLGDRSYIALAWKDGEVICKDDEDIFWQKLAIWGGIDGVWQVFLLKYFWHYLPLWWHANYDRREYVYSIKDLEKVITQERKGEPIENFDASRYDVTPRIKCRGGSKYVVSACYWTEFGGLIRCELPIELIGHDNGRYFTSKFGKEKETVLFPYECGICY